MTTCSKVAWSACGKERWTVHAAKFNLYVVFLYSRFFSGHLSECFPRHVLSTAWGLFKCHHLLVTYTLASHCHLSQENLTFSSRHFSL